MTRHDKYCTAEKWKSGYSAKIASGRISLAEAGEKLTLEFAPGGAETWQISDLILVTCQVLAHT
jgi:hypothetical protein